MPLPLVCPCRPDSVHCFDEKTRKPVIGVCGHTVCLECALNCHTCPVCKLEGSFSKVSVNYTSIALIEGCRNQFWEKWRGWLDTKNPGAGFCSNLFKETKLLCSICVEHVTVPRICLTCDQEAFFYLSRWRWKRNNAVASEMLQRVMCSTCAIDNHGEKGHKIEKPNMDKHSKKLITMALAQNVLNMFKDAIENKKGVIDCFLRRSIVEKIGENLLNIFDELEYIEEWQCGYLGELIKKELIKKYMENVDEKMLDLFSIQENEVCDCSKFQEKLETREFFNMKIEELVGIKPQVFGSGCPLYSWENMVDVRSECSISEKEFSGVAATIPPNKTNCPLCVYEGYSKHQKKVFFLENGVSIIEEICKTEMIPLDKCCLKCLDRLNNPIFFFSCEYQKKIKDIYERFPRWHRQKKKSKERKSCYQNCFMKNSTLWNFVIITYMMADNNLYEVIMYEIEQTDGFVDCQLQKVRMKETISELYEGLHCVPFWEYFDHLSKPIEMATLFNSFKQQWKSFRFGSGEQKAGSRCKCTVIWNKCLENKVEREKYQDLEIKMKDMARYSMTGGINGCPMNYNHGIELNTDVMDEIEDTVGFKSTGQETEPNLAGDEQVERLVKKIVSNIFPFAHLHCQNEKEQLFDNKTHKPYTGSCGHTICSVCIEETLSEECPVCGTERSFEGSQLNEALLHEIKTIKQNAWELFKELWSNEAAGSGACSECNKHSTDLHMYVIDIAKMWYSENGCPIIKTADVVKLSRQVICQECALAQRHLTEKVESFHFWKNYLKRANGIFLLELLEDDVGGENCEHSQTKIQKDRRKLIRVWKESNWKKKNECGYERELIELKLIAKLIENIDQCKKQLSMPEKNLYELIKEKNCPMCKMIDFLDCAKNTNEHNPNEWMNLFEHLKSIQTPRLEKCCIRCLFYLNKRYSAWCQTEAEKANIKKMGNAMREGIEEVQFKNFERALTSMYCKHCGIIKENIMDRYSHDINDEKTWRNLITREYSFCLLQTMTEGLSRTTFPCHLWKIKFHNLAFHFLLEICDAWWYWNPYWDVFWKFFKNSNMLKNLKTQFKKIKNKMDKEDIGVKCECTEIWEKNKKMMKNIGHEDCEEKKKHQDLEDSIEEMARFSLEEDLDGCPMKYNHGIVLDGKSVRKLKEATDLEPGKNENKCLCVQIDSLGLKPNTSEANDYQIVPLFINWWKVEASYPHLLCHVCIERLELIQNRLGTLSGFYNCELRAMRMLKTFGKLTEFIKDFRLAKGRASKENIEWMKKVFDNFISQWDLFQFGSKSDQQLLVPGTVCHCTKTLNKNSSLRSSESDLLMEEKNESLMEVSEMIAEFNLTEIITGCPLDFDHSIDVDCFKSEEILEGTPRFSKRKFFRDLQSQAKYFSFPSSDMVSFDDPVFENLKSAVYERLSMMHKEAIKKFQHNFSIPK